MSGTPECKRSPNRPPQRGVADRYPELDMVSPAVISKWPVVFLGFISILLLSLVISVSMFLLLPPAHFIVYCSFTPYFTAPFRTEA